MNLKNNKEQAAELFNSPDRVTFREFLKTNTGEYDDIEFKGDYIEEYKLAKHIIAMANSGGGIITFGIEEDKNNILTPLGIEIKDKTEIKEKLSNISQILQIMNYMYFNMKMKLNGKSSKIKIFY